MKASKVEKISRQGNLLSSPDHLNGIFQYVRDLDHKWTLSIFLKNSSDMDETVN